MLEVLKNLWKRYTWKDMDEDPRWGWVGVGKSDAGIRIDTHVALTLRLVWQCVNIISDDVAKTPLVLYRTTMDGGKERDRQEQLYHLLKRQPNQYQTACDFWKSVMCDALLGHGAYVYVDRGPRGEPRRLIRLLPECVKLHRIDKSYHTLRHDILYTTPTDQDIAINAEDCLIIKGLSYDGWQGLPLTHYAKNSIGHALALEKYSNKYFGNGAEPRVLLKTDKKLTPEAIQNIRDQWESVHKGLDNAHKTAILQLGLEAQTLSVDPRNSQMIESKQWTPQEIAGWFKIPPNRVGAQVATSYASLEQEDLRYVTGTLDPWLYQIEQQCNSKLLMSDDYRYERRVIEYHRQSLIRADMQTRYAAYTTALAGHPFITVDEVRKLENMPPVGMDEVMAPSNNFGGNDEPSSDDNDAGDTVSVGDDNGDRMVVVRRDIQRALTRVAKDACSHAKHGKRLYKWMYDGLAEVRHSEVVTNDLEASLRVAGVDRTANTVAHDIIKVVRDRIEPIINTATNDNDLHKWVNQELDEYENQAVDDVMAIIGG